MTFSAIPFDFSLVQLHDGAAIFDGVEWYVSIEVMFSVKNSKMKKSLSVENIAVI